MRSQLLLAAPVLAFALHTQAADAGPPESVCRVPTVVDVMAQELQARWYYAHIDPAFIQEQPTADGRLMRCGVCVQIDMYAMAQFGDRPVARCELHQFSVQTVRNGFVVRYLR
ncbi:MAG TPA: hypothetical protein VK741_19350 [Acetobacteraceae bacterium]|jgi:hypothetical protein|nr:hypothetical protein [Acetobacteraceae bacterium]